MQARPPYVIPPAPQPPRNSVATKLTPTWRHNNVEWVYVGALESAWTKVDHLNPKPQGDGKSPNPWWWSVDVLYGAVGYWLKPVGFDGYAAADEFHGINLVPDLSLGRGDAYAKALGRLNADVRNGDANIAIDLIQANRTARIHKDVNVAIRAFAQVEEKIDDRLRKVPKKDRPEVLRLLRRLGPLGRKARIVDRTVRAAFRDISRIWLTWIYGLKPTLQSIYDAAKHTREHYQEHGFIFRGKGMSRDVIGKTTTWPTAYDEGYLQIVTSRRCKLSVVMAIPDLLETEVQRLAQLSPSVLLWETLPLSFVYDWFQNIAQYLSDVETACTYSAYFKRGFRTDSWFDNRWVHGPIGGTADQVYGTYPRSHLVTRHLQKGMERSILSSYPLPAFPRFNPKLGAQRLFTAATLVGALLDRKSLRLATGLYT